MGAMPASSKVTAAEAAIRALLDEGAAGDRLPSEAELAELAGVSRVTVREVLDRLWYEGAIVRRWGAGTFIAARSRDASAGPFRRIYVALDDIGSLPGQIDASGREASLAAFAVDHLVPPAWVAEALAPERLGADGKLWRVTRTLAINGAPAMVMRDFLPLELPGGRLNPTELADLGMDLPRFLRLNGARIVKYESTLEAVACDEETARLLGREPGAPQLRTRQLAISDTGETVSCAELAFREDEISTTLVRAIGG